MPHVRAPSRHATCYKFNMSVKTARDAAVDMVRELTGIGFSREVFMHLCRDDGDAGRMLARYLAICERHIEADRRCQNAL